jgi:hypothetical protein
VIARFTTLLPFIICVKPDEPLDPCAFDRDGYRVIVYPPKQARVAHGQLGALAGIPYADIVRGIEAAEPQTPSAAVDVDGVPAVLANLLQIDFVKDEFDRTPIDTLAERLPRTDRADLGDPCPRLAFEIANNAIARLRTLNRGCELRPLDPHRSYWRLDYLTDDGAHVPKDPTLIRRRSLRPYQVRLAVVSAAIWRDAWRMPAGWEPPVWDSLILDAEQALPDVNAAVALAYAGLETFSKWQLDRLAATGTLPPGVWAWINDRDGDHEKEPSVGERLGNLMRALTGRCLKDDARLWQAFTELRDARHSFMHRGAPMIGKGPRATAVTAEKAEELIGRTKEIFGWGEALLPAEDRRPPAAGQTEFRIRFEAPSGPTVQDPAGE